MKLLVIGGSQFVGRHLVEAASARGDQVTVFNRGQTAAEWPPGVEVRHGDRKGDLSALQAAKRWMHRDAEKVPAAAQPQLAQARAAHPVLDKMVVMREELRQMWLNTSQSREQLTADLQAWCHRAESSGIEALQKFSMKLRAAHA